MVLLKKFWEQSLGRIDIFVSRNILMDTERPEEVCRTRDNRKIRRRERGRKASTTGWDTGTRDKSLLLSGGMDALGDFFECN